MHPGLLATLSYSVFLQHPELLQPLSICFCTFLCLPCPFLLNEGKRKKPACHWPVARTEAGLQSGPVRNFPLTYDSGSLPQANPSFLSQVGVCGAETNLMSVEPHSQGTLLPLKPTHSTQHHTLILLKKVSFHFYTI